MSATDKRPLKPAETIRLLRRHLDSIKGTLIVPDGTCECEAPGVYSSGVPGVLAAIETTPDGEVCLLSVVERCDLCERYASDAEAEAALYETIEIHAVSEVAIEEARQRGQAAAKPYISPSLEHFLALACRRGSGGEKAARVMAMTFLDQGLSLDQMAVDGLCEFMHKAKLAPETARQLIG